MKIPMLMPLGCCLFLLCLWEKIDAVIQTGSNTKTIKNYNHLRSELTIQTVALTQKGYIQFLRYISDVPTLNEYTFCIWMKSNNLTYSHPLLSYSKHEEERLIRVWVSPNGNDINLEILDHPVFTIPVNFVENHWYHICQSWSSEQAAWNLYINGKLKSNGFVPKLRGVPIKKGGDIVVGQEYTDFDKGLDDGIEGEIFGFNFVLSSTSTTSKTNLIKPPVYPIRRNFVPENFIPNNHLQRSTSSVDIYNPLPPSDYKLNINKNVLPHLNKEEVFSDSLKNSYDQDIPPVVLSYFNVQPNREPKGFLDFGRNFFDGMYNFFEPDSPRPFRYTSSYNTLYNKPPLYGNQIREVGSNYNRASYNPNRIINDVQENIQKPLGLKLVELSYNCALRKGAPLSGKGVLISWTQSPVRVFGGAILHSMKPFCT